MFPASLLSQQKRLDRSIPLPALVSGSPRPVGEDRIAKILIWGWTPSTEANLIRGILAEDTACWIRTFYSICARDSLFAPANQRPASTLCQHQGSALALSTARNQKPANTGTRRSDQLPKEGTVARGGFYNRTSAEHASIGPTMRRTAGILCLLGEWLSLLVLHSFARVPLVA